VKFNLFFILLFISCFQLQAQYFYYPYSLQDDKRLEEKVYGNVKGHTSIKPYMLNFSQWIIQDSVKPLVSGKDTSISILVKPVINSLFNQHVEQMHHYGLSLYATVFKKLSLTVNVSEWMVKPTDEQNQTADSTGMLSHVGEINADHPYWYKTSFMGNLYWQTLPYLSFDVGVGKHFLGDGYRSLFLSDNASPYPYLKGTVKIWKIEYLILYGFLNEPKNLSFTMPEQRKNCTLHYLSWNINKRLNINAFETVIWQVHDSIGNRGIDVNYLNPIIFFRPVEYSLGSPDNVIMGAGLRYRIFKHTHLYGQLLIDEFKLSEIKAQKGWWGNKFGGQAGIKTYRLFNVSQLFGLLECNVVRPFTYAHSNYLSNWGNMHEPMASPLGANFLEVIAQINYTIKRWNILGIVRYYKSGKGNADTNAGDNIYRSYNDNRTEYGNYLLVGNKQNVWCMDVGIYYLLNKPMHLKAFIGGSYQIINDEIAGQSEHGYIKVGIVTNLN